MDKLKLALSIFFIVIAVVVGVVAVVVLANNGAFSPGFGNLFGGGPTDGNNSILASNFVSPSLASAPSYDEVTGAFDVSINITNPINTEINVEQFSTQIVSDNGTLLGNISLPHSIDIPAAGNAVIDVMGNLDPALVNQLKEHSQDGNVDIVLQNVNAVVNGISLHFDRIDLGDLRLQLGV